MMGRGLHLLHRHVAEGSAAAREDDLLHTALGDSLPWSPSGGKLVLLATSLSSTAHVTESRFKVVNKQFGLKTTRSFLSTESLGRRSSCSRNFI